MDVRDTLSSILMFLVVSMLTQFIRAQVYDDNGENGGDYYNVTRSTPRMPQVNNPQVRRDMELSPVGPGTVFTRLVQMSKINRDRVNLINKSEEARLKKIERIIEKERRFNSNLQNKVMERTNKTLKEKQALLKILGGEYRFDNFVTMQRGFDSNQIERRDIARRYVMESRIFNSGFNVKSLRPEVHRQLRKLDPNHKYRSFKKKLLANCREQNVEINRGMGEKTFYTMLHDKEHWRRYNDRVYNSSSEQLVDTNIDIAKSDDASNTHKMIPNENNAEDQSTTDVKRPISSNDTKPRDKERSVVMERRLPRRPQEAFGMTMRTLGPVYFQASVHTDVEVGGNV